MFGPLVAQLLVVAAGYLWPAYQTYKSVSLGSSDLQRSWCIYWLVLGFFLAVEWITDFALFWLPLYYEFKVLSIVFLWHPRTKGAVYVFERFLQPLLRANEARIDATIEETKARLADGVTRQFSRAKAFASANATQLLEHMRSFSEQRQPGAAAAAARPHRD